MKKKRITEKEQAIKAISEVAEISYRRAESLYNDIKRFQNRRLYRYLAWVSIVAGVTGTIFMIHLLTF